MKNTLGPMTGGGAVIGGGGDSVFEQGSLTTWAYALEVPAAQSIKEQGQKTQQVRRKQQDLTCAQDNSTVTTFQQHPCQHFHSP